jgi:hypothetical protein
VDVRHGADQHGCEWTDAVQATYQVLIAVPFIEGEPMSPTNFDLSQLHKSHEKLLAKWDARLCMEAIGKSHPRFAAIAPTLALGCFRLSRWFRVKVSPLAYGIWSVAQGILPRIRFQLAPSTNLEIISGHSFQVNANGRASLDKRTQSRIHDMQALASNRVWFDVADQWVFHQAWELGARWGENNSNSSHKE